MFSDVAYLLYNVVAWCAQPLLRQKLQRRAAAEPLYSQGVDERFGRYAVARPDADAAADRPLIWIHAVSLGETRAAAILLDALRVQCPQMRLLLTHGTATGRAEGIKLLHSGDVQVWQPWDTRRAVRRFLAHFRPDIGVLMETEVWPNLVRECIQLEVPIALANARLSEKSLRGVRRIAPLLKPAYQGFTGVWAQSEDDARRLRAAGVTLVSVAGNLKFDVQPDPAQLALGRRWRALSERPVVLLASSREGEEAQWLRAVRALGQAAIGVQWLIVPRHPQRFAQVEALIRDAGMSVSCRSGWQTQPDKADVWLGDSLGEMSLWYALADVALLGGSFEPLGGQNLIEAAACGCPMLLGPHTFNFNQAAEWSLGTGAAQRANSMEQALSQAVALLCVKDQGGQNHQTSSKLVQMRQSALQFASAHRGAAQHMASAAMHMLAKL